MTLVVEDGNSIILDDPTRTMLVSTNDGKSLTKIFKLKGIKGQRDFESKFCAVDNISSPGIFEIFIDNSLLSIFSRIIPNLHYFQTWRPKYRAHFGRGNRAPCPSPCVLVLFLA